LILKRLVYTGGPLAGMYGFASNAAMDKSPASPPVLVFTNVGPGEDTRVIPLDGSMLRQIGSSGNVAGTWSPASTTKRLLITREKRTHLEAAEIIRVMIVSVFLIRSKLQL
jgi:hypothetical protein